MWRFTTGCLAGANAISGRNIGPPGESEKHSSYPRGNPWKGKEESLISHSWPALVAKGGPLHPATHRGYPACREGQRLLTKFPLQTNAEPLPDWRRSASFLHCVQAKHNLFTESIGGGAVHAPAWGYETRRTRFGECFQQEINSPRLN